MLRYEQRARFLAISIAGLAGFVDAVGFLKLGGFFVSFMSGNSTRLAIGLEEGIATAAIAGLLIASFIAGVVGGSLLSSSAGESRKSVVLSAVSLTLAVAATLGLLGFGRGAGVAMALAMGGANTVFQRDGEVSIGVTYMTGTLVKCGQHIAAALKGGNRWTWVPYLMLWLGLVTGASVGAAAYAAIGLNSLWFAASMSAILALAARRIILPPVSADS
jgi:uncharacterized membrane protein YoaK (UPF0700 family)